LERKSTGGSVLVGIVVCERINTGGRVLGAVYVALERKSTGGSVQSAVCVVKERISTVGSVIVARCEAVEGKITLGRVGVGIASVRRWRNCSGDRRERKAGERDEKETAPQRRPVNQISYWWSCRFCWFHFLGGLLTALTAIQFRPESGTIP
jgi:hypothetical protein